MSIEKAYNVWSKQYDTNKNRTRDQDQEVTIQTLDKYNFSKVIELGCGTGKNTLFLLNKADKIIGLDFSEEMLNKAKEKVNDSRATFHKIDLNRKWNVENKFADLITSNLVLEHIKNLDFIFSQAHEKLKPNGIFFICELHPFKQYAGSKARYEDENGIQVLETYTHHITEFLSTSEKNGFELMELKEWFDDMEENEIPRLISFVFKK